MLKDLPPLIYVLTLAILLMVGSVVLALQVPENGSESEIRTSQLFLRAPNVHYHLTPTSLGSIIEQVIECESGWTHEINGEIIRGKAGEYGIAQFMEATWNDFNEERGTDLDITNRAQQLNMVEWAFQNNKQQHWSCYKNMFTNQEETPETTVEGQEGEATTEATPEVETPDQAAE